MFPSGPWKGFWRQAMHGTQPMDQFELLFSPHGEVTGRGTDMVGVFFFRGEYNAATGEVRMTKQYVGKHAVLYAGRGDGEGRIVGTWALPGYPSLPGYSNGPFSMHPVVTGDEPIQEIVK